MKTLARLVMVLLVLGFCLPSLGEILVYKFTETSTEFGEGEGGGAVNKKTYKGYVVIDVNYVDNTIMQGEVITYGKDADGKWFEQNPMPTDPPPELVRVVYDSKVQWVITDKQVEFDGPEIVGGGFTMLAGSARSRNIGTGVNQVVASSLRGYSLWDETDEEGWRSISMSKMTLTLYPSWTYWANGGDEGECEKDFTCTVDKIAEILIGKHYVERGDG